MAYDEALALQVRAVLSEQNALSERKMFGGIGFMIAGNMACGVYDDDLIVQVGPEAYEDALQQEGVVEFDMIDRPMRGWVFIRVFALRSDDELKGWVMKGVSFARTLPAK